MRSRCETVRVAVRDRRFHFHTLALDGVYVRDEEDGPLTFYALPGPSTEDVARVAGWVKDKLLSLVGERGFNDGGDVTPG